MLFLELLDETLDINSTEIYELSVQISPDNLSFCILDTIRNKYVLLRSHEAEGSSIIEAGQMVDLIGHDDFLPRRFKKINIVVPAPKSTLVPAELYDSGRKDEYFLLNHPADNNNIILVNELKEPEAYLIFEMPVYLNELMKTYFPGVTVCHHLMPLLSYVSQNRRSGGGNAVNVHLEKDYFNLTLFDQNSLKFCNTFIFKAPADIRYYILYVLKKLGIKQEEPVTFSGNLRRNDELISGLSDYISNIRFAYPSGNFTFSYVFNDTEMHRFLNLFMIASCE